jgi:aspartate aminotransferase
LISDEIYGLLDHSGEHKSIAQYYPEGTIISSGLSKWAGAGGWRLGTFTFPKELHWLQNAMAIVASETYTSTSAPIQYAAITAFEEHPELDQLPVSITPHLKALGNYITRLKNKNLPCLNPLELFIFLSTSVTRDKLILQRGILTSYELCEALLKETGVAHSARHGFRAATRRTYLQAGLCRFRRGTGAGESHD